MKKTLLAGIVTAVCIIISWAGQLAPPPQPTGQKTIAACVIPDTVKYEAEHATFVGVVTVRQRLGASNDTTVGDFYTNEGVKFVMAYKADAIILGHGGFQSGTFGLKINGVSAGSFTITNPGGWNVRKEASINVSVAAGDTVFVYSPGAGGAVIEVDYIKAYKAPNKLPAVSISVPAANDTILVEDTTVFTATANDTDGVVTAVKFKIAEDTTYIDSVAPYTLQFCPKSLGHRSLVVTAYDDCGDSTVSATIHYFCDEPGITEFLYEGEHGILVGQYATTIYRPQASNDTNVTQLGTSTSGVKIIANEDADGVILGYSTFQTGSYKLKINGTDSGKFTILRTGDYNKIYEFGINSPVSAGDTIFASAPGASIEIDYIKTFRHVNIPPVVELISPVANDTIYLDSTMEFMATASDTDGVIDSVTFLVNDDTSFTDYTAPYSLAYLGRTPGIKGITVTAYDNDGATAITPVRYFLVRTIVPDTLKYEAEHGVFEGVVTLRKRTGASNDTTVGDIYTNEGVKFKMQYGADAIVLGYGTYNPGLFGLKINGVSAGNFTIVDVDNWGAQKEATITVPVAAGDTVFVYSVGQGSLEVDYIKACLINEIPGDTAFVPENEDWDYVVGTVSAGHTIRKDTLDGAKFKIKNDTLIVTQHSFDYEISDRYTFMLDTGAGDMLYLVNITNVTGAFDQNGFASSAVAAKYPEVNEGDYIFWNYTGTTSISDMSKISVSYPNKILIHAKKYNKITLDLTNAHGNNTNEKVVITNFLGQVETKNGFDLRYLAALRLTGKYDSANGYGHRYFKGWDAGYEFPHGTFGLYSNNKWQSETAGHHITINYSSNKIELDNLELGNGGFSGINWKEYGASYTITDSSSMHHCFLHDIGSEGLYLGATGAAPQQVFQNITIENNAFIRCGGEGVQLGWLMGNSVIRNNFVHSGLDWKSPFQGFQDGTFQLSALGGGITVENNILIGSGEEVGIVDLKPNNSPFTLGNDTIHYNNNLIYGVRSGELVHLLRDSAAAPDSFTHVVWDGNYYKQIGEDYIEVDSTFTDTSTSIWDIRTLQNDVIVRNNIYDFSVEHLSRWGVGHRYPDTANNKQQDIPYPQFRNYMNLPDSFNYLNISRYTDSAVRYDPTRKVPATWETGNIVQWNNINGETRLYKCLQPTSGGAHRPPTTDGSDAYWQLLTWLKPDSTISYFPPDDVRLETGSFFDSLNMGITGPDTGSSMMAPNRKGQLNNNSNIDNNAVAQNAGEETPETTYGNNSIKMYPNPAAQQVIIESSLPINNIELVDVLGKTRITAMPAGALKTTVDVTFIETGIYFIRVQTIDGQTTVKQLKVVK